MCGAIEGSVCAIRLAERLLRETNDLWMLGKSAPSMGETANPKRGKRPAEESSRRHMIRNSPVDTSAPPSSRGYASTPHRFLDTRIASRYGSLYQKFVVQHTLHRQVWFTFYSTTILSKNTMFYSPKKPVVACARV